MNDPRKITVVFVIKDEEQAKKLWEVHMRTGELLYGMKPEIISNGDQVTVPGEIVDELRDSMDPECPNKNQIRDLISRAERHRN